MANAGLTPPIRELTSDYGAYQYYFGEEADTYTYWLNKMEHCNDVEFTAELVKTMYGFAEALERNAKQPQ